MAESSPSNSGIQEKDKDGPPAYLLSLDPPDGYSDPDGMRHYAQTVKEIVESFGGIYLVRHHKTRVVEGDWDPLFMVLIRFPSMSKLDAFYDSDLYRPWRELRKKAGRTSIVVAEG
jgi:uncharacterized protein (DUF1330 family)